jgi:hypothetical protein
LAILGVALFVLWLWHMAREGREWEIEDAVHARRSAQNLPGGFRRSF